MNKTIEDLREDIAVENDEATIWLDRRDYHDRERHIAHLHYITHCRNIERLQAEERAANGEAS